jgi:hypothetical protein
MVTRDGDSVGSLGLRGRPFNQVGVFPWVLACITFSHVGFSLWDVFSQIGFVVVDGFGLIMEELVSARSDLDFVDVHGLHGV